ncbi:MAG: peptide/nickel transport system permease protein [Trebonia sp.]|nr:transporter permease [Actinomycetes bacterium]MDX6416165.1 peptide/nickel transport system permease protein [Trebonia sp.]
MIRFLLRRCSQAVVVLLLVSVIVFGLLHLLPGGPARAILGTHATPTNIAAFDKQNGLNSPVPVQYWHWLTGVLSGNLGFSYVQNESVASLLAQRLPKTAFLAGVSVLLAVLLAVPVGFFQAVRRHRAGDYVVTTVALVLYSTPAFWVGILLIDVLAVRLRVFPAEAPQGSFSALISDPQALVLPVLTITLVTVAGFSRYIRSSVLDELAQDYVRMARSKGASRRVILFGHVLRNAAGPVVTLLGLSLPFIVSGTLITEYVFNYPGIGLLAFNAATSQDYPVILGVVIVVGAATVVGSLLADVTHAILDPRVRASAGIG